MCPLIPIAFHAPIRAMQREGVIVNQTFLSLAPENRQRHFPAFVSALGVPKAKLTSRFTSTSSSLSNTASRSRRLQEKDQPHFSSVDRIYHPFGYIVTSRCLCGQIGFIIRYRSNYLDDEFFTVLQYVGSHPAGIRATIKSRLRSEENTAEMFHSRVVIRWIC